MNVVIVYENRLLGAHPDLRHALHRMRRYPVGARIVQVKGAITIAERVAEMRLPHIGFTSAGRFHFFGKAGTGDSHAGVGSVPALDTVRVKERAA